MGSAEWDTKVIHRQEIDKSYGINRQQLQVIEIIRSLQQGHDHNCSQVRVVQEIRESFVHSLWITFCPCATRQLSHRVSQSRVRHQNHFTQALVDAAKCGEAMASHEQNSLESEDGISLLHEKILQVSCQGSCDWSTGDRRLGYAARRLTATCRKTLSSL
jgi:hypothetical protein